MDAVVELSGLVVGAHAVPVVVMTSLPLASVKRDGLYDAVLRKPFTPDLLLTLGQAGQQQIIWNRRENMFHVHQRLRRKRPGHLLPLFGIQKAK